MENKSAHDVMNFNRKLIMIKGKEFYFQEDVVDKLEVILVTMKMLGCEVLRSTYLYDGCLVTNIIFGKEDKRARLMLYVGGNQLVNRARLIISSHLDIEGLDKVYDVLVDYF